MAVSPVSHAELLDAVDWPSVNRALAGRGETLRLVCTDGPDNAPDPGLVDLASALVERSPARLCVERSTEVLAVGAALRLRCGAFGNIVYTAVPEGREVPPFAEALFEVAHGSTDTAASSPTLPAADLWVFVAQSCPHCPQVVRAAMQLALREPCLQVTVIDAEHSAALASRCGVRSVPTTVIDGGLSLLGVTSAQALGELLAARGSAAYRAQHLESLIQTGRFDAAAELIGRQGAAADFVAQWLASSTSTRIAMMLTAERSIEAHPEALRGVLAQLQEALAVEDVALRGDTVDLLGQIGDRRALPVLEPLCADPDPDVAEIARDVVDQLGG